MGIPWYHCPKAKASPDTALSRLVFCHFLLSPRRHQFSIEICSKPLSRCSINDAANLFHRQQLEWNLGVLNELAHDCSNS